MLRLFFVVGFTTDRVAGEKVKGQGGMIVMFTYGIGMLLARRSPGALYNHLVAGPERASGLGDLLVDRRWPPRLSC